MQLWVRWAQLHSLSTRLRLGRIDSASFFKLNKMYFGYFDSEKMIFNDGLQNKNRGDQTDFSARNNPQIGILACVSSDAFQAAASYPITDPLWLRLWLLQSVLDCRVLAVPTKPVPWLFGLISGCVSTFYEDVQRNSLLLWEEIRAHVSHHRLRFQNVRKCGVGNFNLINTPEMQRSGHTFEKQPWVL